MGTIAGDGVPSQEARGPGHGFDYDLVVVGGGSGGLACSKEAAKLGKKVACLDFVKPTPQGTQWGLGGTCVNVGCIPKKLMHQAGVLAGAFKDADGFGWKVNVAKHDWSSMVASVQDYIGSLNWGYRVALREHNVKYINAWGKFTGPHTMACTDRKGKVTSISANHFVLAVGGRPRYPGVPGDRELCLTSDDIFSLPQAPGKTLCVGAGYVALETAGFLTELGYDTSVMARSVILRGFDQDVAEKIVAFMERHGTKFLRPALPVKFEAAEGGRVKVTFRNLDFGLEMEDVFDTVLLAVGREAQTADLGLELAGVQVLPGSGKISGQQEQTSVPHIFAIGDVLDTRQELTPVAIQAGILLARRLYAGGTKATDYNLVPTTVFTPLEYGCVGMSEELAVETYGEENVEMWAGQEPDSSRPQQTLQCCSCARQRHDGQLCSGCLHCRPPDLCTEPALSEHGGRRLLPQAYLTNFKPLEWAMNHHAVDGVNDREDNACYIKVLTNRLDHERVLGVHILGPNAGEILQGYAVAVRMGATKDDLDSTVGIHPTMAEELTIMRITRRSGESPLKTGC